LPHCSKPRARKRAAEAAEVLTSSPFKKRLLEKAVQRRSKPKPVFQGKEKEQKAKKQKKQKKKTCREDKRCGKRNVAKQAQSKVAGEKVKLPRKKHRLTRTASADDATSDTNNTVDYCLFCSEPFIHPPSELWIQCSMCKGWCHEACSAGEGSRGFVCDFCH